MKEPTRQELSDMFNALPPDVHDAVFSVDTSNILTEVGEKYRLHIDQQGKLSDITVYLMIGAIHPPVYISTLQVELNLDRDTAQKIAKDINDKIFLKVRESLKNIHLGTSKDLSESKPAIPETQHMPASSMVEKTVSQGVPEQNSADSAPVALTKTFGTAFPQSGDGLVAKTPAHAPTEKEAKSLGMEMRPMPAGTGQASSLDHIEPKSSLDLGQTTPPVSPQMETLDRKPEQTTDPASDPTDSVASTTPTEAGVYPAPTGAGTGTDDNTPINYAPSKSIAEEKLGGVVKTPSQKVVYPPNTDYTKGHDPYREPIE